MNPLDDNNTNNKLNKNKKNKEYFINKKEVRQKRPNSHLIKKKWSF